MNDMPSTIARESVKPIFQTEGKASVQGALFKALSCVCFAGIYGCVRYITLSARESGLTPMPAPELAFFETFFGLLFILPWVITTGKSAFRTPHYSLYVARALVVSLSVILWYMALAQMPLVQVVAFKYISPLFTILGAKLFLGEKCGWIRAIAIGVAIGGALLITGHELIEGDALILEVSLLALLPLGATACQALSAVFGKKQAKTDSPQTVSLYLLLFTLPIFAVAASFNWVMPLFWQWPWLIMMGGLLAAAYIFLSQAYVVADITYLIPVSFTRLIVATFIGMVLFSEWPTVWTWVGSFFILTATACLCQYELKRKCASA
ncbi:MAG: DMT family transporter [Alphaproteobacteria bacterium]|nr:DMT family transporter [Alphaproteobacteria bacterium]